MSVEGRRWRQDRRGCERLCSGLDGGLLLAAASRVAFLSPSRSLGVFLFGKIPVAIFVHGSEFFPGPLGIFLRTFTGHPFFLADRLVHERQDKHLSLDQPRCDVAEGQRRQ